MLSKNEIDTYKENGFILCEGVIRARELKQIWMEIEFLFRDQAQKFGLSDDTNLSFDSVIHLVMQPDSTPRRFVYDLIRLAPAIRTVQTNPKIYEILMDLGFKLPVSNTIPSVRVDMPGETKFLRGPHQDIGAIFSPCCVTVWFPLVDVDRQKGSIGIFPGSQKNGLIEHYIEQGEGAPGVQVRNGTYLPNEIVVEARPGDIVFMNSLCVHRSYPGAEGIIKFNGQFFYNDAAMVQEGDDYFNLAATYDSLRACVIKEEEFLKKSHKGTQTMNTTDIK